MRRRRFLRVLAAGAGALAIPWGRPRRVGAAPTLIRFAAGGAPPPNGIEQVVFLDYLKANILQQYGKAYEVQLILTKSTPEAATLLAAEQADLGILAFSTFAIAVQKNAVPGGLSVTGESFVDAVPGYGANPYMVLEDSGIRSVEDLRGKKIGVNALGTAVDLILRVMLRKHGLDPKRDVQLVEVGFPNMGPALREHRIDCGSFVLPFSALEAQRGGVRILFDSGTALGPNSPVFHAGRNTFLKAQSAAVRAFYADYVRAIQWYLDPKNREKAVELAAAYTKTPPQVFGTFFLAKGKDYYRDPNVCPNVKAIQGPLDQMYREGFLDKPFQIAGYVDTSYLPHPCPRM